MPKKIDNPQDYGIKTSHEIMDNGQLRFRLICEKDNTAYIRCENPKTTAEWENSHDHTTLSEIVIVQRGIVIIAEYRNGKVSFTRLEEGDFFKTTPGIPHNEILSPGAVIQTVKCGDCTVSDWIPCRELDMITKPLSFKEAERQSVSLGG